MLQGVSTSATADGVTLALGAVLVVFVFVIVLALIGLGNRWQWFRSLGGVHLVALGATIVSPVLLFADTAATETLAAPIAGLLMLLSGYECG